MIAGRRDFADRRALAAALAEDISQRLASAIAQKDSAVIAVSGGATPKLLFDRLSHQPVDWARVTVTLVDERCVPEDNERSNARLVKAHLLANAASQARFVPLFGNEVAAASLDRFDIVVLGMGTDGHTASFLPGGDRLADALDMNGRREIIEIHAQGAGEPRLTFTLPALIDAGFIALHIEGTEKARVLAEAIEAGPVEGMPIRAFLRSPAPIAIFWAP